MKNTIVINKETLAVTIVNDEKDIPEDSGYWQFPETPKFKEFFGTNIVLSTSKNVTDAVMRRIVGWLGSDIVDRNWTEARGKMDILCSVQCKEIGAEDHDDNEMIFAISDAYRVLYS